MSAMAEQIAATLDACAAQHNEVVVTLTRPPQVAGGPSWSGTGQAFPLGGASAYEADGTRILDGWRVVVNRWNLVADAERPRQSDRLQVQRGNDAPVDYVVRELQADLTGASAALILVRM